MTQLLRSKCLPRLAVIALTAMTLGCGRDGPERYQVTGTVNYGGQPVPAGRVIFEPDTSAGHSGPAGYADIVEGEYYTLDYKGAVGGPHLVRVICLSGNDQAGELADGGMLCPEYRETVDLPLKSTVHNIEVPGTLTWNNPSPLSSEKNR